METFKIVLKLNNLFKDENCFFSGQFFAPGLLIFEVLDQSGAHLGYASEAEALKRSFTMEPETLEKVEDMLTKSIMH